MAHTHIELIRQLAKDMERDDWKELLKKWKVKNSKGEWIRLGSASIPSFYWDMEYSRDHDTININGFEVPEPFRCIPHNKIYYALRSRGICECYFDKFCESDKIELDNGLCFKTYEDCEKYRDAILSFTKK